MRSFGDWLPLDHAHLADVPDEPGALQLSRLDKSLVVYPNGKSAMVFYVYAARSMREAVRRVFVEELDEPGASGQGQLAVRWCSGGDDAQRWLTELYDEFVERFGRAPILHPADDDED